MVCFLASYFILDATPEPSHSFQQNTSDSFQPESNSSPQETFNSLPPSASSTSSQQSTESLSLSPEQVAVIDKIIDKFPSAEDERLSEEVTKWFTKEKIPIVLSTLDLISYIRKRRTHSL